VDLILKEMLSWYRLAYSYPRVSVGRPWIVKTRINRIAWWINHFECSS
jgi:hypothetical protein